MSSGKEFPIMNRMVNENETQYVNLCNAINFLSLSKQTQELTVPVSLLKEITDCLHQKDVEIARLREALEDAKLGFKTLYDKFICDDFIASGISQRIRRIDKALSGDAGRN